MNRSRIWIAMAAALAITCGVAQAAKAPVAPPTLADVIKDSPAAAWRELDPANTLYMDVAGGRIVIELAPDFAPLHAANIKTLVREKYFDGLVVLRSQDNYVAQWGDADEKNPRSLGSVKPRLADEFAVPIVPGSAFKRLKDGDIYAPQVGHVNSFPAARDPKAGLTWLTHCYAMVGVGRDNDSDSGNGSSLYVINGHAPRHLDRNVTVVGRVMQGMSLLSSLPRGTGRLGFYEQPEQQLKIASMRVAADLPAAERVKLEVMRSDTPTFDAAVSAVRHRGGDWFKYSPERVELCNVPIVVRERK